MKGKIGFSIPSTVHMLTFVIVVLGVGVALAGFPVDLE